MVVHNNFTPLVILALIILGICVALGAIIVGTDPFGPGKEVKGELALTQSALRVRATENALSAMETPQAILAGQDAAIAQLTAVPPAQTATRIAVDDNHAYILYMATQTVMADQAENQRLSSAATQTVIANDVENQRLINAITQTAIEVELDNQKLRYEATQEAISNARYQDKLFTDATATAMARNGAMENTKEIAGIAILIAVTVVVFLRFVGYALVNMFRAKALETFARARLLNEKRHLDEARTSRQNNNGRRPVNQSTITTIQVKRPGDVRDLPRAE